MEQTKSTEGKAMRRSEQKRMCPYWKLQLLSFDDYSCTKPKEKVIDAILEKMKKDLVFCEKHAEKDFGLPASTYYNSRAACLEHYIEWITNEVKR